MCSACGDVEHASEDSDREWRTEVRDIYEQCADPDRVCVHSLSRGALLSELWGPEDGPYELEFPYLLI